MLFKDALTTVLGLPALVWLVFILPVQFLLEVPMLLVSKLLFALLGPRLLQHFLLGMWMLIVSALSMFEQEALLVTLGPSLMLAYLLAKQSSHDQSHDWYGKGDAWALLAFCSRMFYVPLTQHVPHVFLHHKQNMKSRLDPDYHFDLDRDNLLHFVLFWMKWDVSSNLGLHPVPAFIKQGDSERLRCYVAHLAVHLCCLALAWHRGFGAFGLVYCAIFRTSFDLALLTWTLEHPFVHELEGSFRHNWNTCTMVQEKAGQQLLLDDHAYHHACPGLPQSKGEEHFQDVQKFVSCQLKHRHLMLRVDTYQINPIINRILGDQRDMWAMARAMFSKDYQTVRSFVAFRNLSGSGLDAAMRAKYEAFKESITVEEVQRRLRALPPSISEQQTVDRSLTHVYAQEDTRVRRRATARDSRAV